ncbi:MAG: MATE family efflux transporter [Clostridia bacterium]|nr:MATE family efflux transporter [Clostridia bacterium]
MVLKSGKRIGFNKITLRTFFAITLPLAAQNLITVLVNLVDNIMVGRLGDTAIATVNSANQFFFIYTLFVFGAVSGSGVLMAQFWGKKDMGGIRRTTGLCVWATLTAGLILGVFLFAFPETIMRIFSKDASVIEGGARYIKITAATYPLTALSLSVSATVKNVERVRLPLISSTAAIIINVLFNYLLIFGKFGFPALGVSGAAYATLLARAAECVLIIFLAVTQVDFITKNIKDYFDIPKDFIKKYFKISFPVMFNETLWSIGISLYVAVYARTGLTPEDGTAAVAAANISNIMERLCNVFAFGMAYAVSIIIGKEIGSGRVKRAVYDASQFSVISFLSGIIFGAVMAFAAPFYLRLFALSDAAYIYARNIIFMLSFSLAFRNFTLIAIVGIMRGGGDTLYACILDLGGVWLLGVPCVFIAGILLKLPLEFVFASSLIEEIVKFFLSIRRVKSRKWIHDLVN